MQVVSGPVGRHKVVTEAPTADRVESEMGKFLAWFEGNEQEDPLLKAGMAHLWFVTIHPFEDGSGRIGRAIAEMCLARSMMGALSRAFTVCPRKFSKIGRTTTKFLREHRQVGWTSRNG